MFNWFKQSKSNDIIEVLNLEKSKFDSAAEASLEAAKAANKEVEALALREQAIISAAKAAENARYIQLRAQAREEKAIAKLHEAKANANAETRARQWLTEVRAGANPVPFDLDMDYIAEQEAKAQADAEARAKVISLGKENAKSLSRLLNNLDGALAHLSKEVALGNEVLKTYASSTSINIDGPEPQKWGARSIDIEEEVSPISIQIEEERSVKAPVSIIIDEDTVKTVRPWSVEIEDEEPRVKGPVSIIIEDEESKLIEIEIEDEAPKLVEITITDEWTEVEELFLNQELERIFA